MVLRVHGGVHALTMLTIVVYHYVRALAGSRYPGIKGLSVEAFEGQLDYIGRHYTVCAARDVVRALRGDHPLPSNACLLTFDDGLIDHFTVVFSRLANRGWSGLFFPPVRALARERVLDTHKIQFILACAADDVALARRVGEMVDRARRDADVPSADDLWRRYAQPSRFGDPAEVVFVKRVLQRGLPDELRTTLTAALFEEYVGVDDATFARELYLDKDQLRCMLAHGMEVGGHGAEHVWLDALDRRAQAAEIELTRAFLADLHDGAHADWTMCYPFGAYNADTLELLAGAGCALGMTTRAGLVRDLRSPLELPRLDTNDLPKRRDADPNEWTMHAIGLETEMTPVTGPRPRWSRDG
ncbi:MAG: polysaccharide deacetylase [Candidatus Rokuibacteriota bacterium]|nr:MAG: polysaccharide deacetylase [Candidatus Rokubacteria bacterium]